MLLQMDHPAFERRVPSLHNMKPAPMSRDTVIAWAWNDPDSEKFKSGSQIRQNRDAPNRTGEEHWLFQEEVEEEGPSGEGGSFFDEFDIDHYM